MLLFISMLIFNETLKHLACLLNNEHVNREYCFTITHKSEAKTTIISFIFKPQKWLTSTDFATGVLRVEDRYGTSKELIEISEDEEPKLIGFNIENCDFAKLAFSTKNEEITIVVD